VTGIKIEDMRKFARGGKKENQNILRAEVRYKNLFVIKHKVKKCMGIKSTIIDVFAYVFVRNLLHEGSVMLTV